MAYGIRVTDDSTNELLVTPDILSLYQGGREATPNSGISSGGTYEVDVSLGDTYAEAKLGVLCNSFSMSVDLQLYNVNDNDETWYQSWFVNDDFDYYTRTESTGVITTWTPNATSILNYDGLLSCYPSTFWDKRNATSFSTINMFSGTCYLAYDQSATAFTTAYTLGDEGVEYVDYAIFIKQYQGD